MLWFHNGVEMDEIDLKRYHDITCFFFNGLNDGMKRVSLNIVFFFWAATHISLVSRANRNTEQKRTPDQYQI